MSDPLDPAEEATVKFGTSKEKIKQMNIPIHKVSTWCEKVPNESVRCQQSADTIVRMSNSNNPKKKHDKCKKNPKWAQKLFGRRINMNWHCRSKTRTRTGFS